MNIYIRTIPHSAQRYDTVGDWYFDNEENPKVLFIFISDMNNKLYEFLVAYHEQIEAMLCLERKIKESDVSAFDKRYERLRPEGDFSEPGDQEEAPYYKEHQFATSAEKEMSNQLGLDWEAYEKAVYAL